MVLKVLKSRLQMYLEAEAAILRGAEYTIGDRRLRRANLSEVRKAIDDLRTEIEIVENNHGRRIKRVVLVD